MGLIAVLGSINMDVVLRVARFPLPGETILAEGLSRHPGGKGANQAIAAARAGAAVRLIGSVGDDADGRALVAMLEGEGIDCAGVARGAPPTGIATILVDARGENQIVVASGANATVAAAVPGEATVLLAQLETPAAAVADFFAMRRDGALAILNAAPFRADATVALAAADIIVVNAVELAGYAEAREAPHSPAAVGEMAAALRARFGGTIVVTLGAQGSVTVRRDGVTARPGVAAVAVDTTGAGDCFCGWLAAGLATGQPLGRCIETAHRAAAIAVTRAGAGSAMPYATELTLQP